MSSFNPASGWRLKSEDRARTSHLQFLSSQGQIKSSLSSAETRELDDLVREGDPEIAFAGLAEFARRLERADKVASAAAVYQAVLGNERSPADARAFAGERLAALSGGGGWAHFAETGLVRLAQTASDYRTILPMMAGSLLYQSTRSIALNRMLSASTASSLTRGWGARVLAGLAGTAVEVPAFTLLRRGLDGRGDAHDSWTREMAGTAISLGFLKLSGAAGNLISPKLNFSAGFLGLLGANRIETALGLRPAAEGSPGFLDTLGTLFALKIGNSLGRKVLGPGFHRFENELSFRAASSGIPKPGFEIGIVPRPRFAEATAGGPPLLVSPAGSRASMSLRPLLNENHAKGSGEQPILSPPGEENNLERARSLVPSFGVAPLVVREEYALTIAPEGTTDSSLPQARVVTLNGQPNWFPNPLRMGRELILTAAIFAGFPFMTAAAMVAARYALRKLAPELFHRILALKANEANQGGRKLLGRSPWRSATFREEATVWERAEEIRAHHLTEIRLRAAESPMGFDLYLARSLKSAEPLELEAWLLAQAEDLSWKKIKWLRLSGNPAGHPLLLDVAMDRAAPLDNRKEAVDALAEADNPEAGPVFRALLLDPQLRLAAAGALLWTYEENGLEYGRNDLPSLTQDDLAFVKSWTESFYALRYFLNPETSFTMNPELFLHFLQKEVERDSAAWIIPSQVAFAESFQDGLIPALDRTYENRLLRPFVLESLIDRGFREVVSSRLGVNFRQDDPDLSFAFLDGNKRVRMADLQPEVLTRWARVAGKLGYRDQAMKFLIWQERKLRHHSRQDGRLPLSLADAYLAIGESGRAISLLGPLLRNDDMEISFRAAELLDRVEPGWDVKIISPR